MIINVVFLIFIFSPNLVSGQEVNCKRISFFQETCRNPNKGFSFCHDGYGQRFRLYNYMVEEKSPSIMECYKYGVYELASYDNMEWLNQHNINIPFDYVEVLEQKLDSISNSTPVLSKTYPNLQTRVLNYYKRNDIGLNFDGKLLYKEMTLRVSYVYFGKKKILVPKVKGKIDDEILEEITVDMYIITKIW
jgi:hypothetical protein